MYYNREHYPDPTAGKAIDRADRSRRLMTQKEFYRSPAWRRARAAYIAYRKSIDGGMCEECHERLGLIVHHKVWLNDDNVNDPEISLNFKHMKYDCLICHNKEKPDGAPKKQYRLGENGEILPP